MSKKTNIKSVTVKDLSQDDEILELRPVNPIFVSRYRQAMRNGDIFPRLIVDRDMTIISGNHRYEAMLAEYGEDHPVEVIVNRYKDEAERIEDAVRDNSRHGNPLDGITRKRVVLKLGELGRTPEAISRLMGVSVKRVEELAGISVVVRGQGNCRLNKAVKHGLEHISGTTVKREEYETHSKQDVGVPALRLARQLTRWIQQGWVDLDDDKTAAALEELREELNKHQ